MVVRKTAEQIREEILFHLNDQPLSVEQLRKKLDSNWSTTNNYLEDLSKEGKVKEIISADKAKVYQRIFGDTYFDIPISSEERKKFRTLFSIIIQKFREANKMPNKTDLAKAAVKVINSKESGLSDLPTVWYLYGAIPLMIVDPSQDYREEIIFEHKQKIVNIIHLFIQENQNKKAKQLQREQHQEYGDRLYHLADRFMEITEDNSWNDEKLLEILNEFFIACPIDEDFKEIFTFTEKFITLMRKLRHFDKLENNRNKILLTFDAIWKFIATCKFYETLMTKRRFSDKSVLDLYLGNALIVRKACAEESLSDLYSIYLSKLNDKDVEFMPEAEKVREIMQGWSGED